QCQRFEETIETFARTKAADRSHDDPVRGQGFRERQRAPGIKIPQINHVGQDFDLLRLDPLRRQSLPRAMGVSHETVREAQRPATQPTIGAEFVPAVASHPAHDERVAAPARDSSEAKVAELAGENNVRLEPAQGPDALDENFPGSVWKINLAHGHSHFSQDRLVVAAAAEVKEPAIHPGMEQRPGHVNGLLLGPAQPQAGSEHGHTQAMQLRVHDSQFRSVGWVGAWLKSPILASSSSSLFQTTPRTRTPRRKSGDGRVLYRVSPSGDHVQVLPARAYAMANQKTRR